jgi:hypothetical protein
MARGPHPPYIVPLAHLFRQDIVHDLDACEVLRVIEFLFLKELGSSLTEVVKVCAEIKPFKAGGVLRLLVIALVHQPEPRKLNVTFDNHNVRVPNKNPVAVLLHRSNLLCGRAEVR